MSRRVYREHVVQLVAYAGDELVGSIELEQPWLDGCGSRSFKGKNLTLRGQPITWGHRFRSLKELREWFAGHGASRVHLVYETLRTKYPSQLGRLVDLAD